MQWILLFLMLSMLAACGPKALHVKNPHCSTNEAQITLCVK